MKNQYLECIWLAWRDWLHDSAISICSVIALASMLAPILVLVGLENGVIDSMRARLLEDPSILIITPKSDSGRYTNEFIASLSRLPGARYVIGRTRETATDVTLVNPKTGARASISLEPSTEGEPVLSHAGIAVPAYANVCHIVLSASSAKSLNVIAGDILECTLGRRTPAGKLESEKISLKVSDILPKETADRKMAFVPLRFLEELEAYRDYIAVPERGFTGETPPQKKEYASFRLYAKNLDDVETLSEILANKNIESSARTREIAAIRTLKQAINQVILIISFAIGLGFIAFTISSALSAASRKKRMLGMLRLIGFRGRPLVFYPVSQTIFTGLTGFFLSLAIYYCVSLTIRHAFSDQGNFKCILTLGDAGLALFIVIVLSAISCLRSAYLAASAEPSTAIREI